MASVSFTKARSQESSYGRPSNPQNRGLQTHGEPTGGPQLPLEGVQNEINHDHMVTCVRSGGGKAGFTLDCFRL